MKKALPSFALCISILSCNGTQKPPQNGDLSSRILGFWAFVGTDNATFVIEKKKINYPETFTSYDYTLVGDSIKIRYYDYTGSFFVEMHGKDTLILKGDEKQVYYRFKK